MSMKNIATLNLREYGHVLSTRERGRAVADRLHDTLLQSNVVIGFAGVEVATPSFLDELLTRLRGVLHSDQTAIVVVAGANDDVRESLELVLAHRNMALGALEQGHIRLLGGKKHLQETIEQAEKLGTFKTTELAEALKVKLPNLHQRLKALREAGVVGREPDETAQRGRRDTYTTFDQRELATING